MLRCRPLLLGAALWAFAWSASADYTNQFQSGIGPEWDFSGVHSGAPVILTTHPTALPSDSGPPNLTQTNFLGEFGGAQSIGQSGNLQSAMGDVVKLHLNLPQNTSSVVLQFDAYLLRTWDGSDVQFAGPDTFGYSYTSASNTTNLLAAATFSNGEGEQSYCPGTGLSLCAPTSGSDSDAKNRLGFNVLLDPVPGLDGAPAKGTPMSLLYHFTSGPIPYNGGGPITFNFFSEGLQVTTDPTLPVADESWGIGGINVSIATSGLPEPGTWVLMLFGVALLALSVRHRRPE